MKLSDSPIQSSRNRSIVVGGSDLVTSVTSWCPRVECQRPVAALPFLGILLAVCFANKLCNQYYQGIFFNVQSTRPSRHSSRFSAAATAAAPRHQQRTPPPSAQTAPIQHQHLSTVSGVSTSYFSVHSTPMQHMAVPPRVDCTE